MPQNGTLVYKSTVVADKLVDLINENLSLLDVKRAYWGDQKLIPEYPAVVIETLPKIRNIVQTHQFEIEHHLSLLIYHGQIGSTELTRREVEQLSEAVEELL